MKARLLFVSSAMGRPSGAGSGSYTAVISEDIMIRFRSEL